MHELILIPRGIIGRHLHLVESLQVFQLLSFELTFELIHRLGLHGIEIARRLVGPAEICFSSDCAGLLHLVFSYSYR